MRTGWPRNWAALSTYFMGDASGRPANFALQFRSTLLAAAEEMDDPAARDSIRDIVARTYLEFAAKR